MIVDASQILLVVVAIVAAFAAFHQVSAFKLFELTKFLQEPNFRDARRIVLTKIINLKATPWWDDSELEAAASTCCGHYDIVGTILQYSGGGRLTRHFARHWGKSIIATFDVLHEFLERRRSEGGNEYRSLDWLYQKALKEWPNGGRPWPLRLETPQEQRQQQ